MNLGPLMKHIAMKRAAGCRWLVGTGRRPDVTLEATAKFWHKAAEKVMGQSNNQNLQPVPGIVA